MAAWTFPHEAFVKEGPLGRLTRAFAGSAYTLKDVSGIRTSFYYRDFALKETDYCYTVACAFAHRNDNGTFSLMTLNSRVEQNTLAAYGRSVAIRCLPNEADEREYSLAEIIPAMNALSKKLAQGSSASAAAPDFGVYRTADTIHLAVAEKLLNNALNKYQIAESAMSADRAYHGPNRH